MKIIILQGGLGNQLFQYAFGRALQCKFNCVVKFDLSFFDRQSKRLMCLDSFNTNFKIASDREIQNALKLNGLLRIKGYLQKASAQNSLCIEKTLSYDDSCFLKEHKTYFKGYWQNERYFKEFEDIIRKDFSFILGPSERNATEINNINAIDKTVSLHIRRGDYINDFSANKIHGICGLEYYYKALDILKCRIGKFNLYIFSDDINWAKENLDFPFNKVFVDWNDDATNYEDLRLMSLCKHNIIANSSFSWWGAWLNQNPNKIVIAPNQWFADTIKNNEARDIVPDSWIKL